MAKDENKTISVNGKQYPVDSLTEQQTVMVNHLYDLDRKIANAEFNIDQLRVGRDAFIAMLAQSLEQPPQESATV